MQTSHHNKNLFRNVDCDRSHDGFTVCVCAFAEPLSFALFTAGHWDRDTVLPLVFEPKLQPIDL